MFMLFRKLVLLGGACTLLLAYHGGYWLSDWPWLFYYALISWWFGFSWYIFITLKQLLFRERIRKGKIIAYR
ncbi:hypothetical protein IE992_31215 [Klebsiella pneumoniae]|uniref:Uncharacterized protein n=1 Tax=Klebsiella pneumoniae TaxID=573 RepID=A0A927HWZ5_KLEPN|nr:hypothetical protein [Klebsiella pneumoniae]